MNNSTFNSNETNKLVLDTSDVIVSWAIEILLPCILYAFASIAGSIFNIILIIAILGSRKLRNPPGVMIVVISMSELLLCLLFYPVHIVKMLHGERGIPDPLCKLSAVVVHVATFQTITSFPIVAFNRCVYITKQRYVYNGMFNWTKTALYICLSWMLPVLIIATPIIFSHPDIRFSTVFRICVFSTEKPIYMYVEWLYFIILYSVTMVIYGKVVSYIRSHIADRKQIASLALAASSRRMEVQAVKMVAVASFGFSVCCLPYLTFRIIDPYLTMIPSLIHRIAYGVMSLGSFVNPALFTLSNTGHVLAIKALFQFKLPGRSSHIDRITTSRPSKQKDYGITTLTNQKGCIINDAQES